MYEMHWKYAAYFFHGNLGYSSMHYQYFRPSSDKPYPQNTLNIQGLKWGRVAKVGDPALFDLPGL